MHNLIPQLVPILEAHRISGLDAGKEVVYPAYDGLSLVNIPAAVCAWLGIPGLGAPGLAAASAAWGDLGRSTPYRHVILVVVDGMGLNTLESALNGAAAQPDLSVWSEFDGLAALTSIVPSTTAAALTTLWTGAAPAEHGVMAYEVWLKEYSLIANMIRHAPIARAWEAGSLARGGFDPAAFLPVPTLGPHLRRHGITPTAFQHVSIAHSGLSAMLMKEVNVRPFRSLSDLWVSLEALREAHNDEPTYTYVYWGDLDEHEHLFGPGDPRAAMEFASFSRQLGGFLHRMHSSRRQGQGRNGDTLLLVTADHGHIATPPQPGYELRNHPALRDCLVMFPSGEARFPFVYLRPGREETFLRYLEAAWPGMFMAIPSELALESGLFGGPPFYTRSADRIGDYVIVPQGAAYWHFSDHDNLLRGRHGGMSRTEMLVPLLWAEL